MAMDNENTPDPFLAHEALDRTSMLADMVDNHLLLHPYVALHATPEVRALVEQACDALHKAYQLIGDKTL